MVCKKHRLRPLQVRIAGHDHVEIFFGRLGQLSAQRLQSADDELDLVAQKKPHVERHLIVAAARGVEFAAGRTDQLGQASFDIHMNIFVRLRKLELAAVYLALDRLQAADNLPRITGWNDALLGEHFRVRNTAHDVMAVKPRIDRNRRRKSFDRIRRRSGEASAPELGLFRLRVGHVSPAWPGASAASANATRSNE